MVEWMAKVGSACRWMADLYSNMSNISHVAIITVLLISMGRCIDLPLRVGEPTCTALMSSFDVSPASLSQSSLTSCFLSCLALTPTTTSPSPSPTSPTTKSHTRPPLPTTPPSAGASSSSPVAPLSLRHRLRTLHQLLLSHRSSPGDTLRGVHAGRGLPGTHQPHRDS